MAKIQWPPDIRRTMKGNGICKKKHSGLIIKSGGYHEETKYLLHHSRGERVRLHVVNRDEGDPVLDAQVLGVVSAGAVNKICDIICEIIS